MRDLSSVVPDITPAVLDEAGLARLRAVDAASLPSLSASARLGACVGGVGNVLCIGLNYADHAAEAGLKVPSQPVVFNKHTSSICGPHDDMWLPPGSTRMDWEVELGVVIGTPAWRVSEADALRHVAGYCLVNDGSERSYQMDYEGQWVKGKSYPTHCPLGPWLVTPDEVGDVQSVDLWLDVNGERRQTGNTRTMIFSVAKVVSYLSQFMALQPGDVIPTGTPPGVGLGFKPPVFLNVGDEIRLGSPLLGEQRHKVVAVP
ncbi:fumarylacetoacetate hydrolase family protein [Hydrogenophaga sp. 5NK40-0174]